MDKNHILKEIKRTTEENRGVPLGMARFEKETGIKKYDWYGKYWTRWGDAIREAGFNPNKMQSAYDEKWLIQQLILLIREIRKFPTVGDLKIKSFNSKNFPSHNTFRRLGNQSDSAKKILNYCEDKS